MSSPPSRRTILAAAALALTIGAAAATLAGPATAADAGQAPGAPGTTQNWLPADKGGFGTSRSTADKTWFTLQNGRLSEVYYPRLDTPSVRELDFVVTDGHSFAVRAEDASRQVTRLADPRSLTYRVVQTDKAGRWRLTTTYVTDPGRSTVLADVDFDSLTGKPYQVYTVYEPALSNKGGDDSGRTQGTALVAEDSGTASALVASPGFTATSSGYLGTSDGWKDLLSDYRMDWHYASAPQGNLVQTGQTTLTGLGSHRTTTLALGFGSAATEALQTANDSLTAGFPHIAAAYATGWHDYLTGLHQPPQELSGREREAYLVSAMVLAASEDKTHRGAFVASPTMPWAFGKGDPSGPYHLVWSRDLYQIATALIADGDRAGAERALDFLFSTQQKTDGSFPQNSAVDGTPVWGGLQLDEVAFPVILAAQLGHTDAKAWSHVKRAADFLVGFTSDGHTAPWTPLDRWENQSGYSPATIASEVAGLVCAARIAESNGDTSSAKRYLDTADAWQRQVKDWTATRNGPYSDKPYFLRLTKDGNPDAGTTYAIGDSGPGAADQRTAVDPGFLDLVRLGVLPANDPVVVNSLKVVDQRLGFNTPNGHFWHRTSFDGYGETASGGPWTYPLPADSNITHGRGWPILNGERGEYDLAAGDPTEARAELATMARTANSGYLMPEQVWDDQAPQGTAPGTGTTSATPLAWTHAQYIRLAADLADGRLTEMPSAAACRYTENCG